MTNNFQLITKSQRKSFTLIELLVVLALVAILSVVVVMTLNPAELIKQARDSNRLSDLATINTALNLFSADVTGGFMGTSTIVYVSIPDTSPTCANLGLPSLPTSTYTYSCATTQNLRNTDGTGWVPVNFQRISSNSPISQLPIDPINTTTSLNYYTYMSGGSWKLSALSLESQKYRANAQGDGGVDSNSFEMGTNLVLGQTIFPAGWIKVPGSSTFGTSDFWVMKYEAKCADASGNLLTAPTDASGYQTYANNATPCISANSRYVTSAVEGYPITNISQTNAITYCQSIGARLITNTEWQTIAWNVQGVDTNWSGGSVGSGYVSSGHTDGNPAMSLIPSADDSNGYFGTGQTTGGQKRTLILSNGNTIWDMGGNPWEWTNDQIVGTNKPVGDPVAYVQWNTVSNFGSMTRATAGPLDSSWTSTQGIGQYYQGTADASTYAFVRGGRWASGANQGVEVLYLAYIPNTNRDYLGFRCVR